VPRADGRDHPGPCVKDSVEQVSWFDVVSVELARVLDPGVDRVAGLRREPFEDRGDWSWARWCLAAGGELGCAHLNDRGIDRGTRDRIFGIDERLDVCDPELPEDGGGELLLAEREQEMLCAGRKIGKYVQVATTASAVDV
jgi:hypothetical protein